MRLSKLVSCASLGLALAVGGCGDAAGGGTPISLNTTEVSQLFSEIFSIFDQADISAQRAAPGLLLSRVPRITLDRQVTITDNINCANGGTAAFSGTEASDASSLDVTVTFTGCKTTHYTVGGTFHEALSVTSAKITVTGDGTLDVTTADGRSGSCTIDFEVSITLSGNSESVVVTGTVCGVNASTVTSIS